jgi:predicted membrane channel-forming protein YqfA (hemolysin III family)
MSLSKTSQPKEGKIAALAFVISAVCSFGAILHANYAEQKFVPYFDNLPWTIGAIAYLSGALLYALRFPERILPGKFDLFGNSHNIFHFCVLIGASCFFYGCI